jgi:acyl-homoserine-lactone acylase
MSRRLRSFGATAALTALLASLTLPVGAQPAPGPGEPPGPPDGVGPPTDEHGEGLTATITRTEHGIPHVVADDFASLGFGHGYAAAEDNLCNLADTLITGRGERSKHFGPDARYTDHVTLNATNLQADVLFTNIRDRGVVEDLLADPDHGPSDEVRAMVEGYTAGVNHYLEVLEGDDEQAALHPCVGEDWVQPAETLDLWHGIYAANLLASAGVFVPEIVEASPPTLDEPGLPLSMSAGGFAPVPDALPTEEELRERLGMAGSGFGSNGTALGRDATDTGRGMVLGNPHFPWQGRYRFTQAHLTIPGEYDVAGGMLLGSPVVNIGWNNDVAWTHTVSTAFRFTPYEYRTLSYEGLPTHYLTTDGGVRELDRQEVTVTLDDGTEVVEDVYRTDEGYVLDAPDLLMGWTPISFFALREANAEHLMTLDVFHEMAKASDVHELLDAHIETGGMPWVNTMAADRDGNALYADASVVPNVPDEMVTRCATPIGRVLFELAGLPGLDGTRASADCAWETDDDAARPGIFGRENLPHVVRDDWVINANDSHWLPNPDERLEGFARIIGCEECVRSLRTRMVYRYVLDRLDNADDLGVDEGDHTFSHEQLEAIQHENRVFAAELAREGDGDGDLQAVCAAADVADEVCEVLADWDGRSNIDSVGTHVFREFWNRTPSDRWNEGFDPDRPVDTPRDLKEDDEGVISALERAVDFLDGRGVALDAQLGEQQVAGFLHAPEGDEAIPVGGGPGNTGNANMVSRSRPAANTDRLYAIDYGSSHMQAVSFTDDGLRASTMLTYGIPIEDEHPEFAGQTEIFSAGEWVDFPFTEDEIRRARQATYVVSQDGDEPSSPERPGPPDRPETPGGTDQRPDPSERQSQQGQADSAGEERAGPAGQPAATVPAGATGSPTPPTPVLLGGLLLLAATLLGTRRLLPRADS